MQKYLAAFLCCTLGTALWGSPVPPASNETLRVGSRTVERLYHAPDREFLLSAVIFPKQKRQAKVLAYVNIPFRNFQPIPSDYLQNTPGYRPAIEALFSYLTQAWADWRSAANAWLPKKYQLPDLSFTLVDGYKKDVSNQPRWDSSTLNIALEAVSGKNGFSYSDVPEAVRGVGLSFYNKQGAGYGWIQFFMEQEWLDWFNSLSKTPEEQAAAAEEYKRAAGAWLAGDFYDASTQGQGYDWLKGLSEKSRQYMQTFSKTAPETWHKQGPWAEYNQYVMTHELGHVLGLTHVQEGPSVMTKEVMGSGVFRPTVQDGLRLATLVCWYHNQKAKRQVCLPLQESTEAQQAKATVQKSLYSLQKMETLLPGISSIPAAPVPDKLPQMLPPVRPLPLAAVPQKDSASVLSENKANQKEAAFTPIQTIPSKRVPAYPSKTPSAPAQPLIAAQPQPRLTPPARVEILPKQTSAQPFVRKEPALSVPPETGERQISPPASAAPVAAPHKEAPNKPVCFVCGKALEEGEYYSFAESRHVHKHSECAYRAFARYHKTDSASLARYEDFYFMHVPQDVVQAKADLRALELTIADIRRYAAQNEAAAAKHKQALAAADQAARNRAQLEKKCQFYMHVTSADVQRYARENQAVLKKIAQKQQGGRPLSKKESLTQRYYEQLLKNYQLTNECQALQPSR